jgi:hypothetical protein
MNMSKTSDILQGPDEIPIQFYEHFFETFHLYMPFDLKDTENQGMIRASVVGHAQGDIS